MFFKHNKKDRQEFSELNVMCLLIDNNPREAFRQLSAVCKEDSENYNAFFLLGIAHRKLGNYNEALQIHESLENIPEINKNIGVELKLELAKSCFASKRYALAIRYLNDYHRFNPVTSNYLLFAELYRYIGEYDEAIKHYELYDINTDDHSVIKDISGVYVLRASSLKNSVNEFEKAIHIYPNNTEAYYSIARAYFRQEKVKKFNETVEQILSNDMVSSFYEITRLDKMHEKINADQRHVDPFFSMVKKYSHTTENPVITAYLMNLMHRHHENVDVAKAVATDFVSRVGSCNLLASEYMKLDPSLTPLQTQGANIHYECSICGTRYKTYTYVCANENCARFYSLDFF